MDSSSFDRLTRLFASTRSRRALGAAVLGAVAGLLSLEAAEAAPCPPNKKRCKGKCIPRRRCCTNANCRPKGSGKVCRNGRCQCPLARPKICNGVCIPRAQCCAATDCPPSALDRCGVATCVNGGCGLAPVPAGSRICRPAAGPCDIAEDCDGVSLDCAANQFRLATVQCRAAGCLSTTHLDLAANCTGSSAACPPSAQQACAATEFCNINACVPKRGPGGSCFGGAHECQAGLFCVGGFCCTTACVLPNAITNCATGTCTLIACQPNFGNCDGNQANGCETITANSAQHCGACNVPCPAGSCTRPVPPGGTGSRLCALGACLCV